MSHQAPRMFPQANLPMSAAILPAGAALIASMIHWHPGDPALLAGYLALSALAACAGPRWPSLSFFLALAGCALFPLGHVLLAGAVASASFAAFRDLPGRDSVLDFNRRTFAGAACYFAFHLIASTPAALALALSAYAGVEAAVEWAGGRNPRRALKRMLAGPFLPYLAAAAVWGAVANGAWRNDPQTWLVLPPLACLAHFLNGFWRARTPAARTSTTDALPRRVRAYIGILAASAGVLAAAALPDWNSGDNFRFAGYLAASVVLSAWKIRIPHIENTISPGFVLLLVAIAELTAAEVILIAAASALMQSYWGASRRPTPAQAAFNVSCLTIAASASFSLTRVLLDGLLAASLPMFFVLAWAALYGGNSFMVSRILSLLQNRPVSEVWRECYFWSLPYFFAGAAAAGVMTSVSQAEGWRAAMLMLPVIAMSGVSYRFHVNAAAARR